jgi:phosphoglycolate phosphatase
VATERRRTRLIIFDLDGTLVDSQRDIAESANALLESCGCPPQSEQDIARMVGDGAAKLILRAFAAAGCGRPPDALERFLDIYNSRFLRHTRAYDGIDTLLAELTPRFRLAVLTNKPLHATRGILDGLGLTAFFDAGILGGDGPHPRKPDPAGLELLMEVADAGPDETILVGDSMVDWKTAHAASVQCCLARYGFGFPNVDLTRLTPEDWVIDRPADLAAHL